MRPGSNTSIARFRRARKSAIKSTSEGPLAPTEGRAEGAPLVVDSYLDQAISTRPVDDSQFQIADYSRPLEVE